MSVRRSKVCLSSRDDHALTCGNVTGKTRSNFFSHFPTDQSMFMLENKQTVKCPQLNQKSFDVGTRKRIENKDIYYHFDRFQITQAFNNIIKNAIEAVNKIPNPSVVLRLFEKNKKIYFTVEDNGIGFDEKKVSKLFEPYFTTKDKGTGLGLSIVKKIIEDHGGIIKIEKNKKMAGTTSLIIFEIQ